MQEVGKGVIWWRKLSIHGYVKSAKGFKLLLLLTTSVTLVRIQRGRLCGVMSVRCCAKDVGHVGEVFNGGCVHGQKD